MQFLEIIKTLILGIIQGITEWLPVSSTGHMILFNSIWPLDFSKDFVDLFLVLIQLGSILAVLILYFNKLNPFSKRKSISEKKATYNLWAKVIVAAFPAALIGLFFDDIIDTYLYNPFVVALTLVFYGVLFILLENSKKRPSIKKLDDLDYRTALGIGLFQILALIPGTSRSGSTILGAVFLGTSRYVASEFSFFLAIPMMFGASGLKLVKYIVKGGLAFSFFEVFILLLGMVVSFVVSVFAIKMLLSYIRKHDFKVFGYYRIILGIIVLLYFYALPMII